MPDQADFLAYPSIVTHAVLLKKATRLAKAYPFREHRNEASHAHAALSLAS
jgi:hypothetical protein